jgi:hypothetical protein
LHGSHNAPHRALNRRCTAGSKIRSSSPGHTFSQKEGRMIRSINFKSGHALVLLRQDHGANVYRNGELTHHVNEARVREGMRAAEGGLDDLADHVAELAGMNRQSALDFGQLLRQWQANYA